MSSDLERRLDRLSRLLVDEVKSWDRAEEARRQQQERRERMEDELLARQSLRHERKLLRQQNARERRALHRAERRARMRENASVGVGGVMLVAALVAAAIAVLHPQLWWLLFPALGMGTGGMRNIAYALDARRTEREELPPLPPKGVSPAPPDRPRAAAPTAPHEVDVLCDELLKELAESPEAVRAFLQNPERTVESLRQTCKALDARRQQLEAQNATQQRAALATRQAELQKKRDGTVDPLARQKLEQALETMGQQASALEQLAAMTERVDGEYTSLLVLLQEMRTRVAVARSAGGAVQIDALAQNVQRLNAELEAITTAVEDISHDSARSPVAPVSAEPLDDAGRPGSGGIRQR